MSLLLVCFIFSAAFVKKLKLDFCFASLINGYNKNLTSKVHISMFLIWWRRQTCSLLVFILVGDPGLGKSQLLQAAAAVSPRGIYVCGNATTKAGLTVAVVKDSVTNDYAFEAGRHLLLACFLTCVMFCYFICHLKSIWQNNIVDSTVVRKMEYKTIMKCSPFPIFQNFLVYYS